MRPLIFLLLIFAAAAPSRATTADIAQAEKNPSAVTELILNGTLNEAPRLLKLAPRLSALHTVVLDGFTQEPAAANAVASVAACNNVRRITFRNCALPALPANLRMLTQIRHFTSENSHVQDGEQFYSTIAEMPNVERVSITGNDFRTLPRSFARLRVMKTISLVNTDLQLANGYDLNTKTADELIAQDTVQFGFGNDVLDLTYSCYNQEACRSHLQMFRDVLQGAYRVSNVFYAPSASRAYRKPHPLVKPPVKGMDVYPDVFSYSAMTGSTMEYGSGTKITIPAMAFEDANGSPVTGNVDITYREFRDPVDIVLSGIPMKYDSAGSSGDFESAGMFEINASQNGNEVYLRDDKKIDMQFAVVDTASGYNFYRLDEQKGWQYLESTGAVEQEVIPAATPEPDGVTPAVQYFIENTRSSDGYQLSDTASFEQRYADTAYIGNDKYTPENNRRYYAQKRGASNRLYLRKYKSGPDYTLVKVQGVNYHPLNPEMHAYSGYYWKIEGKLSGPQMRSEYGRKTGINDCRVINEGGVYYLELKYHWGFKRLKAEPVTLDKHNKPETISDKRQEQLFKEYSKRLERRRSKFAKGIARNVEQFRKSTQRAAKDSMRVFERTRERMNETETPLDFPAWTSYVRAEQERTMTGQQRAWMASGNVYQALTLSGMGVFNCDQVRRLHRPRQVFTTAIKTAGAVVVPFIVYVLDKARNMVLTYSGAGNVPVTYGQNATNSLLMVDGAGNLYMSDAAQFEEGIKTTDGSSFEGRLISGPQTTPQSVRESVFGTSPD